MNENQSLHHYKLYDLSEDLISQICDYFFAKPLVICYPFPALSCISCSDYTSLISLVHTNRKLRDLVRNNTDLWSRCLFRFPCFLDCNLKLCKKLVMRCDENYANLKLPTFESYSKQKVDYYMGEVSYCPPIDDDSTLETIKEGKVPSTSTFIAQEKKNKIHHYSSCELELLDSYSEFVNVLCDTDSMDIYFEGFNPLPLELHKRKETHLTIGRYHEKFPHIRCASFRSQSNYVDCNYWFNSEIDFEKKNWWHEMEGIVVSYSSFFSLQDVLKRNLISKFTSEKKNEMKRVNMSINLGEGKSNVLLKNISNFVQSCPNIQVTTTVFAIETQCFSVLYQYLKRVSVTLKSAPEETIVLKDISLPHLKWLDFHGKYQEELNPTMQTLKLHHIKFDNVDAPILSYFELEHFELSVENQKLFPKLQTLELKYSKFRKDFLIDKHYDSLENLNVRSCVEDYNQKLDLYFDSKFHKLEVLKVSEARNIQALDLPKLDDVDISSSLSFHAKDCKLDRCNFNSVTESINIEQSSHPISTSFYMYRNPQFLSLSSPSCKSLSIFILQITDQSICEINVGEINHFSVQIHSISLLTINDPNNFLIFPYSSNIDNLDLSISNSNKNLLDLLVNNLKQVSTIRKIKFSNMSSDIWNQILSSISGKAQEYEVVEYINSDGLYMYCTRKLSNLSCEQTSNVTEKVNAILSNPGLMIASLTVYPEMKIPPPVESATLNSLTIMTNGNQKLINFPIDLQKLSNLETLNISQQTIFSNNATCILKSLTISSSQTVELDMALLPLLTNLKIETCYNLKLHYTKEIDNSKLNLIHINLIDTFNVEFPCWSLSSVKELCITKIKKTTLNTLIDSTRAKCLKVKMIHLPDKHVK
ncbi:predicted protein [Naegleria gruberi]|uniref:Predicted protein n=1 Tax=Naegleria gruberi TaxID=5762 RepID=D2W123_NAEGR|nr:uncharacterized protein NAEGRDRAFT_75062 [Naegleria gruberi]EFC37284.1 predicted protein [Naegleria gruberi]|eukprot:XP_002670028.1 predicted protein [Naegleria gruberi strain NEG-M]